MTNAKEIQDAITRGYPTAEQRRYWSDFAWGAFTFGMQRKEAPDAPPSLETLLARIEALEAKVEVLTSKFTKDPDNKLEISDKNLFF